MKHLIVWFFLTASLLANSQEYEIKFKITGLTDSIAILGYHFGTNRYVKDTVKIKNSEATFSGEKPLSHGMHFIFFPNDKKFLDILIDKDQKFYINSDTTNNFRENLIFKGSEINTEFTKFDKLLSQKNKNYHSISKAFSDKNISQEEKSELIKKIVQIEKERREVILSTLNSTKNETLKDIIGLLLEPEIPKFTVTENTSNSDSIIKMKEYIYYKKHFFDYVNFTDSAILRTPFFIPKFEKYIKKIVSQNPDSISSEAINLIEKSRGNIAIFSYLINYMLVYNEKEKQMGMDKVFVEIAKKYYKTGEAIWADSAYNKKVLDKLKKTEPNLIGNTAPEINNVFTISDEKISLNDLKNEYIIIDFWSPSCGHCKTSVPKLYEIHKKLLSQNVDVQIFSVLENTEIEKWKKFIAENNLTNWINVYDKNDSTFFHFYYDIYSTPVIYILDKNKKIIAKRIAVEQLEDFILNHKKKGVTK